MNNLIPRISSDETENSFKNHDKVESKPKLTSNISLKDFEDYYWTMNELRIFCHGQRISASGVKAELLDRIKFYLETGEVREIKKKRKVECYDSNTKIDRNTAVVNYKNDPGTRAFFETEIGPHFTFKVFLQDHIKELKRRGEKFTYGNLADWFIKETIRRKDPHFQTEIKPQFEFNQFCRDFRKANPCGTKKAMLAAWEETKKQKRCI